MLDLPIDMDECDKLEKRGAQVRLLVSVIVPYYNAQLTIEETITSIQSQAYPSIEIIIVNDGSTRKSSSILKKKFKDNTQIILIDQKNAGVATARNTGVMFSQGEYLLFLDADDKIQPTYIERCILELEKSSQTKLVYANGELFGAANGHWQLNDYTGMRSILMGNMIPCIAVHRRKDFYEVGGFDESFRSHEDWDLWIRMLDKGGEVVKIPESLFLYRKHADGNSLSDKFIKDSKMLIEDWQKVYIKNNDIYLKHKLSFFEIMQMVRSS